MSSNIFSEAHICTFVALYALENRLRFIHFFLSLHREVLVVLIYSYITRENQSILDSSMQIYKKVIIWKENLP